MGRLSGRCRVTRSGPARLWIAAIALGAAGQKRDRGQRTEDRRAALLLSSVLCLLSPFSPAAAAPAPPAERLADDARQYERLGQWDKACQAYVQLLAADRSRPELHERLVECARRLHQARRHRDPVYRTTVL